MKLLSMKEAAEMMGFSAKHGHKTVQNYIKKGLLPCVRMGRTVRIREDDLNAFIQSKTEGEQAANTATPEVTS